MITLLPPIESQYQPRIVFPFGAKYPWTPYFILTGVAGKAHKGDDYNGPTVKWNPPVRVGADGVVIRSERSASYGHVVTIRHLFPEARVETLHAHLSERFCKVGDFMHKGNYVGLVGSTGISTGDHLHHEMRINGVLVNPQLYLNELTPLQMLIQLHVNKTSAFFADLQDGRVALGYDMGRKQPYVIRNSRKKYYPDMLQLLSSEAALWVKSEDANTIPDA